MPARPSSVAIVSAGRHPAGTRRTHHGPHRAQTPKVPLVSTTTSRPAVGRSGPSIDDRGFIGHPAGLGTLFSVELWERFSYYGMRAILAYYMYDTLAHGGLGIDKTTAQAIVAIYGAGVYLLSVIGGWCADRVLGPFHAVLWGGVIIMAGHASLAMPTTALSWVGIALIALGTGFLKPNISTIVGQLYDEHDGRRDAGFTIFYMSVNFGSLVSPLIVGPVKDRWGYHAGFSVAAFGMGLALAGLLWGRRLLRGAGHAVPNPLTAAERRRLPLLAGAVVAIVAVAYLVMTVFTGQGMDAVINTVTLLSVLTSFGYFVAMFRSRDVTPLERTHLAAYLPMWVGAVLFWMIFEQAAGKLATFADERTALGSVLGLGVTAESFQSINPLAVIVLAPLFAALWNRRIGRFPSTATKFAIGVLVAGVSFLMMGVYSQTWATSAPMWALASVFVVQTVGELCLSPVGLSTTTKLAPKAFGSQAMAVWFLASATGQSFAAQAIKLMEDMPDTQFYYVLGAITAVFALVLFALAPWVQSKMRDVDAHLER